jgi:4-amino-4-deoxy-L-arabinose transferase-like glycosyltransferase
MKQARMTRPGAEKHEAAAPAPSARLWWPVDPSHGNYLLLVLIVFAGIALIYAHTTRVGYAPDEPAHYVYVRSMATEYAAPPLAHETIDSAESQVSHEAHQPPLYYAVAAVPYRAAVMLGVEGDTLWRVVRYVNVLVGVAFIWAVFYLLNVYWGREKWALAGAAGAAFLPMTGYMAGVISNDPLVSLFFVLALVPLVRVSRGELLTKREAAWAGLCMGLAMLSKLTGAVLLPISVLALLVGWWRRGSGWPQGQGLSLLVLFGLPTAMLGGWVLRNLALYGTLMVQSLHDALFGSVGEFLADPLWGRKLWVVISEAYHAYVAPDWLLEYYLVPDFCLDMNEYRFLLNVLLALVGIGLVVAVVRARGRVQAAGYVLGATVALTVLSYVRHIFFVDSMAKTAGRLFLPLTPILVIAAATALAAYLPWTGARKVALVLVICILLLFNLLVMLSTGAQYNL